MKLWAIISLGIRGFFSKKNLILLLILTVVLIYGIHKGDQDFKKIIDNSRQFQKNEAFKFSILLNYDEYSDRGVIVFFLPPPVGVFFSNPVLFSELSAKVNSIMAMDIYSNCKNRIIFNGTNTLKFRFSVILGVLGSLMALFLGFEPFKNREFLKFLSGKGSPPWLYLTIVFTRVVLMGICIILILACGILFAMLENIRFMGSDITGIIYYFIPTFQLLIFFFIIGTILGNLKSRVIGISGILVVWVVLVFLYPSFFDTVIEDRATHIPSSLQYDIKKLKTINDFENIYIKERGGAKNYAIEELREIVEKDYLKDEFPKVESYDKEQQAIIAAVIKEYMDLSILMPMTFYNFTCNELSGRGYMSYLALYDYLHELRRSFLLFWITQVFYRDPIVLVNFVTGNENLFKSSTRIPPNYWQGVLINFIYILLLTILSYFTFKHNLYHLTKKEIARLEKMKLGFNKEELNVKFIKGNTLINGLYAVFSGKVKSLTKRGVQGEVIVQGKNLLQEPERKSFVYICHPRDFPGEIMVKDLLVFFSRWNTRSGTELIEILNNPGLKPLLKKQMSQLEDNEPISVIIALLRISRGTLYLIQDITGGISIDDVIQFKMLLDDLTKQGAMVIYLTTPYLVEAKAIREGSCYADGDAWKDMVESNKHSLNIKGS